MYSIPYTELSYALVFWTVYILWFILEMIGATTLRVSRDATARVQDHGSRTLLLVLLYGGLFLCFLLASVLPGATIFWHRHILFGIGVVLMIVGITLRWYAIRVLGSYFTSLVAVRTNQQVVQSGPYRFIRHPAYSGTLLTLLGIGLAMTNWASLVAIMLCNIIGYTYRVIVEEVLSKSLGQSYIDYMQHTRRFIPLIF